MGAVNKKKSQYSLITSDEVTASTRVDLLHVAANKMIIYGDLSGVTGTKGLLYKLWKDLFDTWITQSLPANNEDNRINLGASTTYRYIEIVFTAIRGTKMMGGSIMILNTGTEFKASWMNLNSHESDSEYEWLTLASFVVLSPQIQISLATDDSDVTTTSFKYKIKDKITI
jgi:hypothetical protein